VTDGLIPPDVGEHHAALLRRAYTIRDQHDGQELYAEWAETYDNTMVSGLGYVLPAVFADRFAAVVPWRDGLALDVGCGTGLVGVELSKHGFPRLDGLDLSEAMMAQAERRGVYRRLAIADLTLTLDLNDCSYDAVVCTGTFTSGHVTADCLDELLRVLCVGGFLAVSVHDAVWQTSGFADAFDRLQQAGRLELIEMTAVPFYANSPTTDGRICIFRRFMSV
jgi:predicted TPR repeat methyltransferase